MRVHRRIHINRSYLHAIRRIPAIIVVYTILLFVGKGALAQQTEGQSPAGTNYLLYLPPNYDSIQAESPLLITLMGGGEIGNDFQLFLKNNANRSPAWLIHRDEWPSDYPFVVLTPQLPRDLSVPNPNDQVWPTALIDEVVTHVTNTYNINEDKIYITGVSLGAKGCWDYAASYPQKVAAMVPMSGPADASTACTLKDIPIWAMHGGNDGLVDPFSNSTVDMVNAINNCNGQYQARVDLIASRGHDIWNDVYTETMGLSIYNWLLNFEKGQSINTKPYVGVGPDLKLLLPNDYISLYGFGFDVDGTIVNYNWELVSSLNAQIEVIDNNNVKLFPQEEGLHQIKLTVTDDDGLAMADTIKIECFVQVPGNLTFMTGLMLQDGTADLDLFPLETSEDNIINLFNLGTSDINIRAIDDGVCSSFRYAINGYQNIRTENREAEGLLLSRRRNPTEWNVSIGSYTISATPYPGNKNNLGLSGISVISRLLVFDQAPQSYHLIPNSDISLTANWLHDTTTENPSTFEGNFQTFTISDSAYLNNPILATGVVTDIRLTAGSYLTLNDSLAIPLILDSAATLQINHPTSINFKQVHPKSKIIYNTSGSLDIIEVGDLTITAANLLNISKEHLTVNQLVLQEGAALQNNTNNLKITVQSDFVIEGSSDFNPSVPFSMVFDNNTKHQLHYQGSYLSFNSIALLGNDTLEIVHEPRQQIHSSKITLSQNGFLDVGQCDVFLSGDDVLSDNAQSGSMKLGNQSTLSIEATPTQSNYLRLDETGNTIKDLQFNLNGTQKIVLADSLKIYGEVLAENGNITSNGYLTLLATDSMTAYILNNTGTVEGDVKIEKLIPSGKVYRYIGSSAGNYSVAQLQESVPVTGTFTGASTGDGLGNDPSIFSFDSENEVWIPFPAASNQELFEIGKGYAIYFRNENAIAKIKWLGALTQNSHNYSLSGNSDVQSELTGWNLVANPYATPVLWDTNGWSSSGINNTVTIADNSFAGGRYLVWDGEVGDIEFSGVLSQNQAFWVRSINETPSLTITESAKVALSNTNTYRTTVNTTSGLVISLAQDELVDRLFYKMNPEGAAAYIPEKDAVKKLNTYFNLYYQQENTPPIAIKNLANDHCFQHKLGIEGLESGHFSLNFEYMDETSIEGNFILRDQLLDSLLLIEGSTSYDFSVHPDDALLPAERFILAFEFSMNQAEITVIGSQLQANYTDNIQWYKDSLLLEGQTSPILSPTENGSYYFEALANACQLSSKAIYFAITANQQPTEAFYSYPNPLTNNKLTIHAVNFEQDYFEIKLINANGQEVMKLESIQLNHNMAEIRIPESVKNGLYYVAIRSNNKTIHHKIIISR